jgi:hypothetical protein
VADIRKTGDGVLWVVRLAPEILAKQFLEKLSDLTEFCASASDDGLTPQDFPDAQLSESELDDILTEFGEN